MDLKKEKKWKKNEWPKQKRRKIPLTTNLYMSDEECGVHSCYNVLQLIKIWCTMKDEPRNKHKYLMRLKKLQTKVIRICFAG